MNRRKLERHLTQYNCTLLSHGANHDKWRRTDVSLGTVIPRHGEIKYPLVRSICRDLGIPVPSEK